MAPHRRLVRMLLACIFGMVLVLLAAVPAAAGTEPPGTFPAQVHDG
jgi:hypothetical protein